MNIQEDATSKNISGTLTSGEYFWHVAMDKSSTVVDTSKWKESAYWQLMTNSKEWTSAPTKLTKLYVDEINLGEQYVCAKYATQLLKEFVFEEARRSTCPDLPSRKKCLFLFSSTIDPKIYCSKNGIADRKWLFKATPIAGHLHRAKYVHLAATGLTVKEINEKANRYWTDFAPTDDACEVEILFEGKIELELIGELSAQAPG